jgi:hypothetical protein
MLAKVICKIINLEELLFPLFFVLYQVKQITCNKNKLQALILNNFSRSQRARSHLLHDLAKFSDL